MIQTMPGHEGDVTNRSRGSVFLFLLKKKEGSANHIDSQEDSGGKTYCVCNNACPQNNEDIVDDLHQYLFPRQNRDKEPCH